MSGSHVAPLCSGMKLVLMPTVTLVAVGLSTTRRRANLPIPCPLMACELRVFLTCLNGWKKSKEE